MASTIIVVPSTSRDAVYSLPRMTFQLDFCFWEVQIHSEARERLNSLRVFNREGKTWKTLRDFAKKANSLIEKLLDLRTDLRML